MNPDRDAPLIGLSTSELRTRKTRKPVTHGEPSPVEE